MANSILVTGGAGSNGSHLVEHLLFGGRISAADISKARTLLGYEPKAMTDRGLTEFFDRFLKQRRHA